MDWKKFFMITAVAFVAGVAVAQPDRYGQCVQRFPGQRRKLSRRRDRQVHRVLPEPDGVSPLRRRRAVDPLAGALDPAYPPPPPEQNEPRARPVDPAPPRRQPRAARADRSPGAMRRFGRALADLRRRVVPLPDEVIHEFLGSGEEVLLSDHPSFRSFVVENTLLFIGFFAVGIAFLGITFNGSTMASGLLLLGLAIVLLVLLFRRLAERYTSYVVTDARIMRIKGHRQPAGAFHPLGPRHRPHHRPVAHGPSVRLRHSAHRVRQRGLGAARPRGRQ